MHGKGQREMISMLADKDVFFADYPWSFRHGTFVKRTTRERVLTLEELAVIPEKNRPSGPVLRTEIKSFSIPQFNRVGNRTEVVMNGADAQYIESE